MSILVINCLTLTVNLINLSLLWRMRHTYRESDAPILLPNGKLLIKSGVKIEKSPHEGVIKWSYHK